ncbi:N-acetylneuraminate synthase family protein [Megasphaera sueciensis]|uniref:N-acetylneuraminate synthase family protein n=1 Tax=Megasphaera sueciensis TaxID=349094 RepID=UPI003D010861
MTLFNKPLFTFEMANNHQGSIEHGKRIIHKLGEITEKYKEIFDFAVKFQYRDLDTFIRPDYLNRDDIKNVKRFKDTKLTQEQFLELKAEVEKQGMYTMCTPFDEVSAERVGKQNYDIIKVASCSFADWPLLEVIAKTKLPVIASTAGSSLEDIDKVVAFFEHRHISLALMHCVAEYPTIEDRLEMNQITLLKERYPQIPIGFSTHENPLDIEPIKIAVAKGAEIFEKHVGLPTEKIQLNMYSATPEQADKWIAAALKTYKMCGVIGKRYISSVKEQSDLAALQRGVFAKKTLQVGDNLDSHSVYFAFPCEKGQLLSGQMSKYASIVVTGKMVEKGKPIFLDNVTISDSTKKVHHIVCAVMHILKKSHVVVPMNSSCEISHHYGLDTYQQIGVTIIDCINREYCKKILILLPGQEHPMHLHKKKEETFTVLYGDLEVTCDEKTSIVHQGESMVVERGMHHSFKSKTGCVFEEVSTTHYPNDSFYENAENFVYPRKTKIYLTNEMICNLKINE